MKQYVHTMTNNHVVAMYLETDLGKLPYTIDELKLMYKTTRDNKQ